MQEDLFLKLTVYFGCHVPLIGMKTIRAKESGEDDVDLVVLFLRLVEKSSVITPRILW